MGLQEEAQQSVLIFESVFTAIHNRVCVGMYVSTCACACGAYLIRVCAPMFSEGVYLLA